MDCVLDDLQVSLDTAAAADAVHDGRQPDRHVGRHLFLRTSGHRAPPDMLSAATAPFLLGKQPSIMPPYATRQHDSAPVGMRKKRSDERNGRSVPGIVSLTGPHLLPSMPRNLHAGASSGTGHH